MLLPAYARLSRPFAAGLAGGTQAKREAAGARAAARLAERAGPLNCEAREPAPTFCTGVGEHPGPLSKKRDQTETERRMMKRAGLFHGWRSLALATTAALVAAGLYIWNRVVEANRPPPPEDGPINRVPPWTRRGSPTSSGPSRQATAVDRSRAETDWGGRAGKLKGEAPCQPCPAPRRARPGRIPLPSSLGRQSGRADSHPVPLEGHQAELVEKLWPSWKNTQARPDQPLPCGVRPGRLRRRAVAGERWSSSSGFITKSLLESADQEPWRLCATARNPAADTEATGFALRDSWRAGFRVRAILRHQHPDRLRRRRASRAGGSADGRWAPRRIRSYFRSPRTGKPRPCPVSRLRSAGRPRMNGTIRRPTHPGQGSIGRRRAGSNGRGSSAIGLPSARPCRWVIS